DNIPFVAQDNNGNPSSSHEPLNVLPLSTCVWAMPTAVGSVRGYDELVPFHIRTTERRRYPGFRNSHVPYFSETSGIIKQKKVLSDLHYFMGEQGFSEMHSHQDGSIISITRRNPDTGESFVFISHLAFRSETDYGSVEFDVPGEVCDVKLYARMEFNPDMYSKYAKNYVMAPSASTIFRKSAHEKRSVPFLAGLEASATDIPLTDSTVTFEMKRNNTHLSLKNFGKGTVIVLKTKLSKLSIPSFDALRVLNTQYIGLLERNMAHHHPHYTGHVTKSEMQSPLYVSDISPSSLSPSDLSSPSKISHRSSELSSPTQTFHGSPSSCSHLSIEPSALFHSLYTYCFDMDLSLISEVLFGADREEDKRRKRGCYSLDGNRLAWAGLEGFGPIVDYIISSFDLGHPLCENLRNGTWAVDYLIDIFNDTGFRPALTVFQLVKCCPSFLRPWAFGVAVTVVRGVVRTCLISRLIEAKTRISSLDWFEREVLVSSVSFYSKVPDNPMIDTSIFKCISLAVNDVKGRLSEVPPLDSSIPAGFDHFTEGIMRMWGRDSLISVPGLFLAFNRDSDALSLIVGCACLVRHGLVPNLLDCGRYPRYNARDATWFFMHCVALLMKKNPAILSTKIVRMFPSDNMDDYHDLQVPAGKTAMINDYGLFQKDPKTSASSLPCKFGGYVLKRAVLERMNHESGCNVYNVTLADIICEILVKHSIGITFREWNAGDRIDSVMTSDGFDISTGIDPLTGFTRGGNPQNCGTWMDKMGSGSNNRGIPSTPRDGSAIELVALQHKTLSILSQEEILPLLPDSCHFVLMGGKKVSLEEWCTRIEENFERAFWIPTSRSDADAHKYWVNWSLVNKKGIYKDTFGASSEWCDYQFRSNVSVALSVDPELFIPTHAIECLRNIRSNLIVEGSSVGVKTLTPSDSRYRPAYESTESDDPITSCGAAYHCGPEWVWPYGHFMKAWRWFTSLIEKESEEIEGDDIIHSLTQPHYRHMEYYRLGGSQGLGKLPCSLPELTNHAGQFCGGSCVAQAWSIATMCEFLFGIEE
ncbi:Glycogen debranching enzyme, partial [Aduncisulcus paluster]